MLLKVYIHCNLLAWDPETLDESKKACNYDQENGRWWWAHLGLLKFSATLCWRWSSVTAPVAGGSCLMTPDRILFVAAATRPASLAPGEECIWVFLLCCADTNIFFFCLYFLFLFFFAFCSHNGPKNVFFPYLFSQDPRDSATNLFWDHWSLWSRLIRWI